MLTEDDVLLPTYGPRPVTFERGSGAWLTATDGTTYLDFLCGLAVTSLGHAHPAVTAAVADQAATLMHTSNLFGTRPALELADTLRRTLGWDDGRTFFCNSGAEANEAALKLARRHGKQVDPQKVNVVALTGGFHGRLLGALKLTGNPAKHAPFEPLGTWVTHVALDDPDALRDAVDDQTCAIWVEVVQGEGGVVPISEEMLAVAREACDRHDALLVVDEVQTGIGRLGAWFGWQTTTVEPDVVCLAKGLANGLPIGAIVARGAAAKAFQPGDHATTFGGGPVVCAAANAVMQTIEQENLLEHARRMSERLTTGFEAIATEHHLVTGWRGRGLLLALVLSADIASELARAALRRGLIVNPVSADAIRVAPPLNVAPAEVDDALARIRAALSDVESPLTMQRAVLPPPASATSTNSPEVTL